MNVKNIIDTLATMELSDGYKITTKEDIGPDIVINCPYHKQGRERTGSFSILKEDKMTSGGVVQAGTGHCFACGVSKSLPQLVADLTGDKSIEQSEVWLRDNFNYVKNSKPPIINLLPEQKEVNKNIPYKHYKVDYHPFFEKRRITRESVKFFELGIDNEYGYAVFPVKDKQGNCRMLFKRSLEGKRFYNTAGAKKDDILFGLNYIYENLMHYKGVNQVWVVESVIDSILLWQRGYLAVAMLQAIPTKEQLQLLRDLPFEEIIIGTDNDEAGRKGLDEMYRSIDKTLHRVIYPDNNYKDIGDFKEGEVIYIEQIKKVDRGIPLG